MLFVVNLMFFAVDVDILATETVAGTAADGLGTILRYSVFYCYYQYVYLFFILFRLCF